MKNLSQIMMIKYLQKLLTVTELISGLVKLIITSQEHVNTFFFK